jgi:Protein of unknown function (DUF3307)
MVWSLLLAHLIADYPLQPEWIVINKSHKNILALHALIQLVTMLIIMGPASRILWPYLVLIACIHFAIDWGKISIRKLLPGLTSLPYIIDQFLHYGVIWVVSYWITIDHGAPATIIPQTIAIYLISFLLITYVWYISERIFSLKDSAYRQEVIRYAWSRMAIRASSLSILLIVWKSFQGSILALAIHLDTPYHRDNPGQRALITDILVVAVVFLLTILALNV